MLIHFSIIGEVIKHDEMKCVLNEGMPHRKNPMERGKLVIHFDVEFPNNNWLRDPKKLLELEQILPARPAGGPTSPYAEAAASSPATSPTADGPRKASAKKGSASRRSAGAGEDSQKTPASNPSASSTSAGGATSGNTEDPAYWNSVPGPTDFVTTARVTDFDAEAYVRQRQEEAMRRGFGSRFVFAGGPHGAHGGGGDDDESDFGGGGGGQRVQCASS